MRHRTSRMRWPALVVAGVVVAGSGTAYAVTNDGSAFWLSGSAGYAYIAPGASESTLIYSGVPTARGMQSSGPLDSMSRSEAPYAVVPLSGSRPSSPGGVVDPSRSNLGRLTM